MGQMAFCEDLKNNILVSVAGTWWGTQGRMNTRKMKFPRNTIRGNENAKNEMSQEYE